MLAVSQIEVIINNRSGVKDKQETITQITEIFTSSGLKANISLAKNGEEVIAFAKRAALSSSTRLVVAGGGDGTVSAVASAIAGTEKVLGILPLGTLNHFAKDMRIPLDLESAARNLLEGRVVMIDIGTVNERVFINNSSLGLYPHIVHHRQKHERKGLSKWTAFLWALLIVLRRYPLLRVRLEANEQEFTHRTPFVFIGNNQYNMNFFDIGSRGCLDAGQLSIYIAPFTGRWGLLRLGLRAFFGKLNETADFNVLCAKEVWVETRRKLRVSADGEVFLMATPLHYKILPGALRVLVPVNGEEGKQ